MKGFWDWHKAVLPEASAALMVPAALANQTIKSGEVSEEGVDTWMLGALSKWG